MTSNATRLAISSLGAAAIGVLVVWAATPSGLSAASSPLLLGLPLPSLAAIAVVVLNLVAFVPAAVSQTERYYDLVGAAATLLSTTILILGAADSTALIFAVPPLIWACRLGAFLARRAHREGDGRFDQIKVRPARFLVAWALQSLWVNLTNLAVTVALAHPSPPPPGLFEVLGVLIWVFGFTVEVVADRQKSAFRALAQNRGRFIDVGLWSVVRHPNYAGEITAWSGLFVAAIPRLEGWGWLAVLSPVFVFVLLRFGSGIPLLEARGRARWGDDPAYQRYLAHVPRLVPRAPSRRHRAAS